jgi:hypothetical protein
MNTLSTTKSSNISKESLLNAIISKQSVNAASCVFCEAGGSGND